MSSGGYAKIERGENVPNLARLQQIANIFNISLSELLPSEKGLIIQVNDGEIGDNRNQVSVYSAPDVLQHEIDKLNLIIRHQEEIIAQKDRELAAKEEIIALLKK